MYLVPVFTNGTRSSVRAFFILKFSVQFNLNQVLVIDMVLEKTVGQVHTECEHVGIRLSQVSQILLKGIS